MWTFGLSSTFVISLEFIEGTVHAFFILIALHKRLHRSSKQEYPAREVITLLIMLDLSLWFEETTTTTKNEANPFQLAFYHVIPWSIIAAIATPLQIFFRFHASVCLSHVWENMYILPAYEPIAPHGLWSIHSSLSLLNGQTYYFLVRVLFFLYIYTCELHHFLHSDKEGHKRRTGRDIFFFSAIFSLLVLHVHDQLDEENAKERE